MSKRESLAARFRRVLGRPLPEADIGDLDQEGSEERVTSRRRGQVLHAQRTHRHRTQQYIRELEREVFRLRDENDELRQTIARMRSGSSRTAPAAQLDNTDLDMSDQNLDSTQLDQQIISSAQPYMDIDSVSLNITVDLTGLANAIPVAACGQAAAEMTPPSYKPFSAPSSSQARSQKTADISLSNQHNQEVVAQLGINFILALEADCFPHVKQGSVGSTIGKEIAPPDIPFNSGSGHLLTATSMLAHRYHDHDIEHQPLSLPSVELDNLLQTSARLRLDGELTPVQIWMKIKQLSSKGDQVTSSNNNALTEERVDRLLTEFGQYAYCNGYGAVVEKRTAELVLSDVFGFDVEV